MKKFILRVWECDDVGNWQSTMYEYETMHDCYRMIEHIRLHARNVKRHYEIYEEN